MPNALVEAYQETLKGRPDPYRLRRLLEEVMQLFVRRTWTLPTGEDGDLVHNYHRYERMHVEMLTAQTWWLGGDEYTMTAGSIYSMTHGEFFQFVTHVPASSWRVSDHEMYMMSGIIQTFARETD